MLTINPNIIPGSGKKFTVQNRQTNQNLISNSNIQNLPHFDTFTKNNLNDKIAFTGFFDRKPLPILGRPSTEEEISLLKSALVRKNAAAWNWFVHDSKYSEYFNRLEIDPPEIKLIKEEETPKNYKDGNVSRYNWADNSIAINLSHLPNLALISKGNVALVSQNTARNFIRNAPEIFTLENEFEDLGNKRSLGYAIDSSEVAGKSYYYKLSPEETAELATQYIAQEMDRAIAFHVLLNTETIGGEHELINERYNNLKDTGKLLPGTRGFWIYTYPGLYKERDGVRSKYPIYRINGFEKWKTAPNLPALSHKELYNDFVATDNFANHPKSSLELGSLIASKKYMENYNLAGNNARERERLELLYQHQLDNLEFDIEERINTIKRQR